MSKVKTFLQKWIINNLGFKILALVFACVLWLVITNITDPVITRTITGIPVEIQNEELVSDGTRVYTVLSGNTATVVVSGNRSVVGSLVASDFVATADFSELSITNAVPISIELTGDKARYASAVTITSKTNSMVINLEEMGEISLDVEVQIFGTQPEDMIIEDAVSSPARVTLYAPESVLEIVGSAVAAVDYKEVSGDASIEKELILYDRNGAVIEQNEHTYLDSPTVSVQITTSNVKTVPLSIVPVGTPKSGYEYTGVTFSKNPVSIRGNAEALASIEEIVLPSELLNIDGATGEVSVKVDVQAYLPYGVVIQGDTGTVTVVANVQKKQAETENETETTEEETESTEGEEGT